MRETSKKRSVLITGSGGGIGASLVRLYLEHTPHTVVAHYHSKRPEIPSHFEKRVHFLKADFSKEKDVEKLAQTCVRKFDGIDILINNAATLSDRRDFHSVRASDLRRSL